MTFRGLSDSSAPTFEIRLASLADAEELHAVAAETFPMACPPGSTVENVAAFIAENLSERVFQHQLVDPARTILLVESDGRAIGYSMLDAMEPSDPDVAAAVTGRPTVELSKFYVLASGHGRGIAMALMADTLEQAAWRGAASVWLGVNEKNARANRFYDKCGFETVGMKRFQLGDNWENDFVMERTLSQAL
ncbi:MAG: GNAT family N-acetyltransferase [Terrimesophilobacter sp.]